jgi:hypothetical protein
MAQHKRAKAAKQAESPMEQPSAFAETRLLQRVDCAIQEEKSEPR